MIYLLMQISHSSPDLAQARVGISSPLADYVKFLPFDYSLSTFYDDTEIELLVGTSLWDATKQKLASLDREFEEFRSLTDSIAWCQEYWWDEDTGHLTLQDWKIVDAMYRSRALDLPNVGDSMVPIVDMANHAPDDTYNARFEIDSDGNVYLLLRDGKSIQKEEEITIQYGVGGACEMVFSYGFLDQSSTNAREIFLGLDIPLDDPLRAVKKQISREAPGVRLYVDEHGRVRWESQYVWWACINEEDGLKFQMLRTNDGGRHLHISWKDKVLNPADLADTLQSDERGAIYRLRAIIIIQERLENQGLQLEQSQGSFDDNENEISRHAINWPTIRRLRVLEEQLLMDAFQALEQEVRERTQWRLVLLFSEANYTAED